MAPPASHLAFKPTAQLAALRLESLTDRDVTDISKSVNEPVEVADIADEDVRSLEDQPRHAQPLQPRPQPPIIDVSQLRDSGSRQAVVEEIGRASEQWGFFQVINHGIPKPVIEKFWAADLELFQIPSCERAQYDDGPGLPQSVMDELSKSKPKTSKLSLWKHTIRFRNFDPEREDALSHTPEFFRRAALEYFKAMKHLGVELFQALSESLGLDTDYLLKVTGQNPTVTTSLHCYFPSADPSGTIVLAQHTDIDSLTIVLQDEQGGLQVLKDDKWADVTPVPHSFVVNIGDAIQVLTNGKFKSVIHRVMNSREKERRSVACFFSPIPQARIGPLPEFTHKGNPPRFKDDFFNNHYYNYFAKVVDFS